MKKLFCFFSAGIIFFSGTSPAQAHDEHTPISPPLLEGFQAYFGLGLLHSYGEIKQNRFVPARRYMNENMAGFAFSLQKSVSNAVSLKGMLVGGHLQGTNREITLVGDQVSRGAYFRTGLFETTMGVHLDFHHLLMPWVVNPGRKWRASGYITIGFAHFNSQIYSLKTGEPASNLKKGIANTGPTNEVVVPVGLQLSYRVSQNLDVNLDASLRFTATDKLDGWIDAGSKNDKYSFAGLGLTYRFGGRKNPVDMDAEKVSHNFKLMDVTKMWKAQRAFKEKNYLVALALYQELHKNNQNNAFLNYRIGLSHLHLKNKQEALAYLNKAHNQDAYVAMDIHLKIGEAFHYGEELDSARKHYHIYRNGLKPDDIDEDIVNVYLDQVAYARFLMENPVDVVVKEMSEQVNSQYPEYSPSVTADGKTLVFTSRRPGTTGKSIDINDHGYYEDIYISSWQDSTQNWSQAQGIKGALNTDYHDAALSISPDGTQIYVYKNTPNRTRSGDIYISEIGETGRWSAPQSLGKEINTSYFESSASVTPDGKTLYFVSERKDGYGRGDIYKSYRDSNGVRHVENLGPIVNTSEDEIGVYIHPDGKTLYFASKGHHSMGGYDIFRTVYTNGEWSEPENLGYPINTTDDNMHFILTTDEKKAFYSSIKKEGVGDIDLYEIDMSRYVIPSEVSKKAPEEKVKLSILRGHVTDSQTGKDVGAEITLTGKEDGSKIAHFTSNGNGEYFITLVGDKTYQMSLRHGLYETSTMEIMLPAGEDALVTLNKDVVLERKEKLPEDVTPELFAVKNIQFEFQKGSSQLIIIESSKEELNKLIDYMKRVESFKIEISGHTDNSGSPDFNYKLSRERAQVVGDYFVKNGIDKDRTLVTGYGSDVPIADNETEEGRARNRRVEVRIVE